MRFNKVLLMGNVTRDPEVKYLPSGQTVAEFGLAINEKFKSKDGQDQERVVFVDCSAFGKQADVLVQWVKKGKPLFVEGKLRYDTWEDKTSGAKRSKLSVLVDNFQFIGGRDQGDGQDAGASGQNTPQRQQQPSRQPVGAGAGGKPRTPPQEPPFGDEQQFTEADIPFLWRGRVGQPV